MYCRLSCLLSVMALVACHHDEELEGHPADPEAPDIAVADAAPPDTTLPYMAEPDGMAACEEGTTEPCEVAGGCLGTRRCRAGVPGDCTPPDERCDGSDNDCDGITDEDVITDLPCETGQPGACAAGRTACIGEVICLATTPASAEICDGLDNDCDGASDESDDGAPLARACYDGLDDTAGVGPCREGRQTCEGGAFGACEGQALPGVERCDGVDNDCDGVDDDIDDGLCVCMPGAERLCYTGRDGTEGVGTCRGGTQTCSADGRSFGPCLNEVVPVAESCASRASDRDCDGATDDAEGSGAVCSVGVGACQTAGLTVCDDADALVCYAVAGAPGAEICDGIDNDCNGSIDDVAGAGDACTVGLGVCAADGMMACDPGTGELACDAIAGAPGVEVCDGIDDDCDGTVDNGLDGLACDTGLLGICAAGLTACVAGEGRCVQVNTPTEEQCGGLDANCDGVIDNPPECRIGLERAYGHHGQCAGFNACVTGETCANAACAVEGYGPAVSWQEGGCVTLRTGPVPGLICNLFHSLDPLDLQRNWGNFCDVSVVYDVVCEPLLPPDPVEPTP